MGDVRGNQVIIHNFLTKPGNDLNTRGKRNWRKYVKLIPQPKNDKGRIISDVRTTKTADRNLADQLIGELPHM